MSSFPEDAHLLGQADNDDIICSILLQLKSFLPPLKTVSTPLPSSLTIPPLSTLLQTQYHVYSSILVTFSQNFVFFFYRSLQRTVLTTFSLDFYVTLSYVIIYRYKHSLAKIFNTFVDLPHVNFQIYMGLYNIYPQRSQLKLPNDTLFNSWP